MTDKGNGVRKAFDLTGQVAIITGGAGLLGFKHAEAIAEMGGVPVLLDVDKARVERAASEISERYSTPARGLTVDITDAAGLRDALAMILRAYQGLDILINNAAVNPKVEGQDKADLHWSHFENFHRDLWDRDVEVGLTGSFLCSQVFGTEMARRGKGVILNIASDLAIIAPDQRIYRKPDLEEQQQFVKPVTYSVVKAGLLGLTRYLATYWADRGVRVNALVPGGVYNGQPADFVEKLVQLIPLGRMAKPDEYKAAVLFLVSEASSYMTGASLVIDGGRTCW